MSGIRTNLAGARWLKARSTEAVMRALQGEDTGEVARFVGGCVRNALLGLDVKDVDIATVLEPPEVVRRLEAAGLKAVPTGIDHGTVTGVAHGKPYEITTLRRDVSTDGRHAVVAFTTDWTLDAQRRDFTINAIYAGLDGTVYDPVDGINDLEAGHIRFIGDARHRIREDYLRILRFFRMHAWYGEEAFDAVAMDAIEAEREGLKGLSGERIQKELLKLLEADDPVPSLEGMVETGVMRLLLPEVISLWHVRKLVALETEMMLPADGIRRLASLMSDRQRLPKGFAERLKLSNAMRERLSSLLMGDWDAVNALEGNDLKAMIYRAGIDRAADLVLLAAGAGDASTDDVADKLDVMRCWPVPAFPLKGADIMAAGVPRGPEVGKVMKDLEEWWIGQGFKPDKEALKARLKKSIPKGEGS